MSQPEACRASPPARVAARRPSPLGRSRIAAFGPGASAWCCSALAGATLNSDFATLDNALNVLTRTAFIGIIAVGMCFVIILGGIDLSVGSMAALIAGCVILFINWAAGASAARRCWR